MQDSGYLKPLSLLGAKVQENLMQHYQQSKATLITLVTTNKR